MSIKQVLVIASLASEADSLVQPRSTVACNFTNVPEIPYYWDENCVKNETSIGCLADGQNPQCRFCGVGDYSDVYCPASWCSFDNPPHLPYYWDSNCTMGKIGCNADNNNVECRFCGEYPYNGTVQCPASAITPADSCMFDNEPDTPYFWDAVCEQGMLGCKADGKHFGCRFCGVGDYAQIHCPRSLCTFEPWLSTPLDPYGFYWEPACWNSSAHVLGCLADGIHAHCRYCGGGEYTSIECPSWSKRGGIDASQP